MYRIYTFFPFCILQLRLFLNTYLKLNQDQLIKSTQIRNKHDNSSQNSATITLHLTSGPEIVSSLLIQTVKPRDAGTYTCAPSNARNYSVVVHVIKGILLKIILLMYVNQFFKFMYLKSLQMEGTFYNTDIYRKRQRNKARAFS